MDVYYKHPVSWIITLKQKKSQFERFTDTVNKKLNNENDTGP